MDDTAKNDFKNALHSSSFFPTFKTYTKVTQSTKTIIVTNICNSTLVSGFVLSVISDHYRMVLFLDLPVNPSPTRHKIKRKIFYKETIQRLSKDLQAKAWYGIYNCSDADTA